MALRTPGYDFSISKLVLFRCLALLHEMCVNVRKHSPRSDRDLAQKLVQLLVVSDGELNVSGNDSQLLSFLRCVPCKFKNFGNEVL